MKKLISLLLCLIVILPTVFIASAEGIYTESEIMRGIPPETTVAELKTLLADVRSVSNNGKTLGNTEVIGTGYSIVCASGTVQASVLGDLSRDAEIDALDYLLLKRHYLGNHSLNELQMSAADIDQDGSIDPYDYLCIKRHIITDFKIGSKVNAASVPVLLYHHILPDEAKENSYTWKNNNITIAISEFTRQMQIIKDSGYTVVTMEELVEYVKGQRTLPKKSVVICFDDGYLSNTYYAAPILRQFGYKATIFAIMQFYVNGKYQPNYIIEDLQHFSPYDLEPNKDVFTVQCHTYNNHNHLPTQTYNQIYNDLMLSQNSFRTRFFAYPYGEYNATVKKAVQDAGFEAAFTTVERNVVVGDDLFELPRRTITSPMSDDTFRSILTSGN